MDIEERLINIRTKLIFTHPFFGTLLIKEKLIPANMPFIAATDGIQDIFYDPEKLNSLTDSEITAVLIHEVLHIICLHFIRSRNRDKYIWRLATDYAVNYIVNSSTNYSLPSGALLDSDFADMTAEEIYDELIRDVSKLPQKVLVLYSDPTQPNDSNTTESYQNAFDDHIYKPLDSSEIENIKEMIKGAVSQAYEIWKSSNQKGNLPASLQRIINDLGRTLIPWYRILYTYVGSAFSKDEYVLSPPNRRYLAVNEDLWRPSLHSSTLGQLVVSIDTSASISTSLLKEFASGIIPLCNFSEEITLLTCDCKIHEVVKTEKIYDYLKKLRFRGGGGTSHIPVFNYIKEKIGVPELYIGFTDLYSEFPKIKPPYDVIWVVPKNAGKPPAFGRVVEINTALNKN